MIDHTGVHATDVARSKAFYRAALAPLGYAVVLEFEDAVGFGVPPKPDFWVGWGKADLLPTHVAFRAANRKEVDAFYKAAIAAGAGGPAARGAAARPPPHSHSPPLSCPSAA